MVMTNTSATGETPDADDPQGETPTTSGNGETPGTTAPSNDDAQKEIERLKASLKRANAEAKAEREAAEEGRKLKQEKLTETEKLQKQLADLQKAHDAALAEAKESRLSSAVQLRATQLGFADPDDAMRFVDRSKIDEDFGNLDTLLKDLLKAKPYLAGKATAPNVGATAPARSTSSALPALSWEVITELQKNPAEYNARNATGEISRWIQAHPFRYGQKN